VRRAGLSALATLRDPRHAVAKRLLEAAVGEGDAASRRIAVAALGEVARRAPDALPREATAALREIATAADDGNLRNASARVLRRLAAEAAPAKPTQNSSRSSE
jgi:hypothetical protein